MTATQEKEQPKAQAILSALVYEVLNGRPLYYRGYKEVIEKNLNPEHVMGTSSLQSLLITLITAFVMNNRDKKRYLPFTNEAGVHLDLNSNLSCDIAIFEKGTFEITTKYFDVPPKIVIEVDIKVDLSEFHGQEYDYVAEKTQRLFDFGVERVFWVFSKSRRVFVCLPGQDWIFTDWNNDISIMDGCILNVKHLLEEEEITY